MSTATVASVCADCDGSGEVTECVNDGRCGCSHTYDRSWWCLTCGGTGEVEMTVSLFECRGLADCHALIEWRGLCPSCAALACDLSADAERELS